MPHADVLQSIIKSQLFNGSEKSGLIHHFLEGEDYVSDESDFDVNILDITSVRNLVSVLRKRYKTNETAGGRRKGTPDALNQTLEPVIIPMAFRMMHQSIFTTKYRLLDTNPYRNQFKNDKSYNIALLVGSMDQVLLKMDNLRREMLELGRKKTHFLWYLIIYEKLLTMNVDVGYMANRIFALHEEYLQDSDDDRRR